MIPYSYMRKHFSYVGEALLGRPLLSRQRLSGIAVTYKHDQRGPRVKPISEIATSNGLFRPVFQDIRNIRVNSR